MSRLEISAYRAGSCQTGPARFGTSDVTVGHQTLFKLTCNSEQEIDESSESPLTVTIKPRLFGKRTVQARKLKLSGCQCLSVPPAGPELELR